MITKITLMIALCSNFSTQAIQSKMKDLETKNPGSKISLRIDQKAQCAADGSVIEKKSKSKKVASN